MSPQQDTLRPGEIRRTDISAIGEFRGDILVPVAHFSTVDHIGAAKCADQPLDPRDGIRDMSAAGGCDRKRDLFGPVFITNTFHVIGNVCQRLVPRHLLPGRKFGTLGRCASHRMGQAVRVINQFRCRLAFGAQLLTAGMTGLRLYAQKFSIFDDGIAATTGPALCAKGGNVCCITHEAPN